jgi:hypothetical protein
MLGKEIKTLVNEDKPSGIHEVEFNASSLGSGMYVYRMVSGSFTVTRKMLVVK